MQLQPLNDYIYFLYLPNTTKCIHSYSGYEDSSAYEEAVYFSE